MRAIAVLLFVLLVTSNVQAQQLKSTRLAGESAEAFVMRMRPSSSKLAHPVIETDVWGGEEKSIIAFYEHEVPIDKGDSVIRVTGDIFVPAGPGEYQRTLIGDIEEEGGRPEIKSVFFANADKDNAKELVVIVAWHQVHYDVYGDLYATLIYDNPGIGNPPGRLTFLAKISTRLDGGCDCSWRDGKTRRAKYKTAADVKRALRRMRYK